ncbi:MAG: hypothetical protein IT226_11875 [Flavobacteriales bacterium]|nr:hypothetical protein [Flavobacteriales bacterium]
MPTRTHSSDPFAPRGALSREHLLAYAEGRLDGSAAHEVELHLERDPLLREAVEGLREPGAFAALKGLDAARSAKSNGIAGMWVVAGVVVLLIAGVMTHFGTTGTEGEVVQQPKMVAEGSDDATPVVAPLLNEEIVAAEEQPKQDRIGHERMALHTREAARLVLQREPGIERVQPRGTEVRTNDPTTDVRPAKHHRTSLQLLFLHDLKVVHPKELYDRDPMMNLSDIHVAARFADASDRDSTHTHEILLPYTEFMDDALGRFVKNDHKGCLDDLRFLLDQHPDDVNALFYSGLCAYNLGLYDRARGFLQRAAGHPVDVFDEEAAWYYALTLDRLKDPGAYDAFQRIANGDGFYSELAKGRITAH